MLRKYRLFPAALLTLAILGGCAEPLAASPPLEESVESEIARLEKELAGIRPDSLPPQFQEALGSARNQIANARSAKSPLLRLYRLRDAFITTESLAFIAANRRASENLGSFERLWNGKRSAFDPRPDREGGSLLQRALTQGAANRGEKLFRASLPYAKVDSPLSGLYYVSEAEGNRKFREWVEALAAPDESSKAPSERDLSAALNALDTETLALFEQDPVSRNPIPVSAKLKEAREMLESGRLEGATLALIESRLGLTRRQGIPAAVPALAVEEPRESFDALLRAMTAEGDDETSRAMRAGVLPLYASLRRSSS